MKISDLTSEKSKQLAVEAGKRLARMVNDMQLQLPAAKKQPKLSFKDFAVPQPMMESEEYDPWQHQEHDDPTRRQKSWRHQLDVLIHKLVRMERDGLVHVDPFPSTKVGTHQFEYKIRKRNIVDYRCVTPLVAKNKILNRQTAIESERLSKRIRMIVDRINQIFDLGGAYYQ